MLGTILLVILIVILLGGVTPFGGYGGRPYWGTGYFGGGGIGIILIIVLVLLALGRI